MIEGLVGLAIVAYLVALAAKEVLVDCRYAMKGKLPPRVQRRMAEINAATKAGKAPRPTFGDYLATVLMDAWEEAKRKREAKLANPKKTPARNFLSRRWADGWESADKWFEARKKEQAAATPPASPATPVAGPATPPAGPATPPVAGPATPPVAGPATPPISPAAPVTDPSTPPAAEAQPGAVPPSGPAAPPTSPASPSPATPETRDPATPSPGVEATPDPASTDNGQGGGQVIQFPIRKDDSMSNPGEVTGLTTAQAYAAEMSTAMGNQVPLTEGFVASLQSAGVSGEAVSAAVRAQELSALASAAWAEANTALAQQNVVKEAYAAVPEAGSREFVTNE
ncbi:hypothetical protein [Micromonospora sp. NPDC049662]|uniref:hypothetical protein n=1 Tax=Micromonospora sp. NPDC049662 TaxID=3155397 RepID=UPI003449EB9E